MVAGNLMCINAARLEGFARRARASGESLSVEVSAIAKHANVQMDPDSELETATKFVKAINVNALRTLGNIRDILFRLEAWRAKLLRSTEFRKTRTREAVKEVMREIRAKVEMLNRVADLRESEGEVDDGGEMFPSERDNICKTIDKYEVDATFLEGVHRLCEALDAVRVAFTKGENEAAAVTNVSMRLDTLKLKQDYRLPHISCRISTVLGEEWRWVTKRLAERSQAAGTRAKSVASPPSVEALAGGLLDWMTDVALYTHLNPMVRDARLKEAYAIVNSIESVDRLGLAVVRTCLRRLELCQRMVAECIISGDPVLRKQIRDVLQLVKAKSDALHARARQLESAGISEDDPSDLLPSERNNICKSLDEHDLAPDLYKEVKQVCNSMDKLHRAALNGGDTFVAMRLVLERMDVVRGRPGYADMPFAGDLEAVFSQEWRWLSHLDDFSRAVN